MNIKALALILPLAAGLLPAAAGGDSYSRLLTSGPWCSVRPAPDGQRIRIVFRADGHYVLGGDPPGQEGYWKMKGRALHMGEAMTGLQAVASGIRKRRGKGYILFVDGEEFSRCR